MRVSRDVFGDADIAHDSLKGQVEAATFASGTRAQITVPVADLRLEQGGTRLDRQILFGHPICQLSAQTGLSRDETTGYVGYVPPAQTGGFTAPTHRVRTRATFLFSEPDLKSPNPMALSCGSLVSLSEMDGTFSRCLSGGYVFHDHLTQIDTEEPDLAKTAELLLGTPYLWGGNSAFGIDCSGLVQLAAQAAGLTCPGDSDQQMAQFGTDLPQASKPRRNDLFFWKGHVALVFDDHRLIHANAHHMAVAFEPIEEALRRIETRENSPLLAHKRL